MKVHFIRCNYSYQTSSYYDTTKTFFWFQIGTGGWTTGARNRVKQFNSVLRVFEYLNKLNAGGWLSDDDYDSAWKQALLVQQRFEAIERLSWCALNLGSLNSGYLSAGLQSGDHTNV